LEAVNLAEIVSEIPNRIHHLADPDIPDMCERENTFAKEKRDRGRDWRG
jgi:hypothetical protein